MDEFIVLNELYDYYGKLLTEKQRSYFEDYYFDNLTIIEIAQNNDVSKNAVSKSLLEIKEKLYFFESVLNLSKNKEKIKKELKEEDYLKIEKYI